MKKNTFIRTLNEQHEQVRHELTSEGKRSTNDSSVHLRRLFLESKVNVERIILESKMNLEEMFLETKVENIISTLERSAQWERKLKIASKIERIQISPPKSFRKIIWFSSDAG